MLKQKYQNKFIHLLIISLGLFLAVAIALLASSGQAGAAPLAACGDNASDIGGSVWRDYNANGTQDATDIGFGATDMIVTAYNNSNIAVATVAIESDGTYVFPNLADGNDYRLEFSGLPSYLQFGAFGTHSTTGVTFVNAATCNINMGVNNPVNYCQTNPSAATPRYVNGDADILTGPMGTMMTFSYDQSSIAEIAEKDETGSLWGVAYDSTRDTLYSSAVLRRHTDMGTAGAGGIYAISAPASNTPGSPEVLHTIPNIGAVPTNTARELDNVTFDSANHDPLAFPLIGKVGIGDLEISEDGDTLYALNLNDKLVYTIDLNSPTTPAGTLPAYPATTCNNGEARPWALKAHDGLLYLGLVCSAESGGTEVDLDAYIYAYDGANWSVVVDNFALDYPRAWNSIPFATNNSAWQPWKDTFAEFNIPSNTASTRATPILSDIEFDDNGNMILGFLDRSGLQFAALNFGPDANDTNLYQLAAAGDILKATSNGDGTFSVENITNNSSVLNAPGREFYQGDEHPGAHREATHGGLAVLPGSNQVIVTGMDPTTTVNDGGIYWMNNSTGLKDDGLVLFRGRTGEGFFGKSHGLGDIELLCDPAPLEVGNRLWCDIDEDGTQTPGEVSVGAGVDVTMVCGSESATIQTDANGEYYFTDAIWATQTADSKIPRETSCSITVDYTAADSTIAAACSYSYTSATIPNADGITSNSPKNDPRDSDGIDNGTSVSLTFVTGKSGENNHSLDFGFIDRSATSITLSNQHTVTQTSNWAVMPALIGLASVWFLLKKREGTVAVA